MKNCHNAYIELIIKTSLKHIGTEYLMRKSLKKIFLFSILAICVCGLATYFAYLTQQTAFKNLEQQAKKRLGVYGETLNETLTRFRHLPFTLSKNPEVLALLQDANNAPLTNVVNLYLETLNEYAGSTNLYIMDSDGKTLASSNWNSPGSFVGNSYSWRPYFINAMKEGKSRYYAIGWTTGVPGYFISRAVKHEGKVIGVAVAKVDLRPIEKSWLAENEIVALADEYGVLFLSSHNDWRYQSLEPLSLSIRKTLERHKRYHNVPLDPLRWKSIISNQKNSKFVQVDIKKNSKKEPNAETYPLDFLHTSFPLEKHGWVLHNFSRTDGARTKGYLVGGIVMISITILILLALYLHQRRIAIRTKLEAHESLERQVDERTKALKEANVKLRQEVKEREKIEKNLRETQDELVQAGKLAALGQMSAAMSHELNQPLTAIDTFISSGRLLLRNQDYSSLDGVLKNVKSLVSRMGKLTTHLKTFARRSEGCVEKIRVNQVLDNALSLTKHRSRHSQIDVKIEAPEEDLYIMGDAIRLEQVFINLINNAIDSMADCDKCSLDITLKNMDKEVQFLVSDTGPGIENEHLPLIFDPFFTTKKVGDGLGLGLSISYGIIQDFDGAIRAKNNDKEGSTFIVTLPKMQKETEHREHKEEERTYEVV